MTLFEPFSLGLLVAKILSLASDFSEKLHISDLVWAKKKPAAIQNCDHF